MRWIETIRARTPEQNQKWLSDLLLDSAITVINEPGLVEARIFRNSSFRNYMAVAFTWDTDAPSPQGSRAALTLARDLKASSLVEHSVWIEEESVVFERSSLSSKR
ncbi:MAG TPA: hypothetical protein VGJ94_02110 [Syntrophorhabdaceae bacterium]|jgi:hypothetical protein